VNIVIVCSVGQSGIVGSRYYGVVASENKNETFSGDAGSFVVLLSRLNELIDLGVRDGGFVVGRGGIAAVHRATGASRLTVAGYRP
jgi:hypothetical protein